MFIHGMILILTCKQQQNFAWDSTISLFDLNHSLTSPTRIFPHSSTLIDHIYVSDTKLLSNMHVPVTEINDHFKVCYTWAIKSVKTTLTVHSFIVYRCFKNFEERAFLMASHLTPLESVYNFNNPNEALSQLVDLFLYVVSKFVLLRKKLVKH